MNQIRSCGNAARSACRKGWILSAKYVVMLPGRSRYKHSDKFDLNDMTAMIKETEGCWIFDRTASSTLQPVGAVRAGWCSASRHVR